MTEAQKQGVKEIALQLYKARRISLEMALWAMKNAGFTREETAEWFGLSECEKDCKLVKRKK
jgi:hypothetical protein